MSRHSSAPLPRVLFYRSRMPVPSSHQHQMLGLAPPRAREIPIRKSTTAAHRLAAVERQTVF